MPDHRLLFAQTVSSAFLTSGEGLPVWPVMNAAELAALETLAESFGGDATKCPDTVPRRLAGERLVVALGTHVAQEGELYAHLTGRACVVVDSIEADARWADADVLVTTEDRVTERLLDDLAERVTEGILVGLVYAPTVEELREQVLVRSAAAYLSRDGGGGLPALQRVDLLPTVDVGYGEAQHWHVVGKQASADSTAAALAAGAGVLSLVSHSDGIDSPLSGGAILCAIQASGADATLEDAPACVVTGMCHRMRVSLDAAAASGALLAPDLIRARILVLDVCWGLLPPLGVIHPQWGLGRHILRNAAVGAFITCWEIIRSSAHFIAPLVDRVAAGAPVGEALRQELASAAWKKYGRRMCLVGDPRVRLPSPVLDVTLANKLGPPLQRRRSVCAEGAEFLRAYVTAAQRFADGTYEDCSGDVLTALGDYQRALWAGYAVEGTPEHAGAKLRDVFIRFALGRFSVPFPIWQPFADDWIPLEPQPCFGCGRRAAAMEYQLCLAGGARRRVTNCQNCGTIEDVPADTRLTFSVRQDGEVELHGELPVGAAGLMLETSIPEDRVVFPWPSDARGRLARTLHVPPPWPKGPLRVSITVLTNECRLIALGIHGRGERLVQGAA